MVDPAVCCKHGTPWCCLSRTLHSDLLRLAVGVGHDGRVGGTGGGAGRGVLGAVVIKAVGWTGVVDATDGGGGKRASIVASIPSMVVTEA